MILQGQVAIVTRAGQGIGKAISLRFAKEGADIGILDIHRETATKTSEEIHQEGRRSVVIEADVSSRGRNSAKLQVTETRKEDLVCVYQTNLQSEQTSI